jgi:FkbM family methyltransferase
VEEPCFRDDVALYRQLIASGDLCFDIGANIGNKTAAMLAAGAKVIAVEPQPKLVRELRARFGNRAIIVSSAVSSDYGSAKLYLYQSNVLASLERDWHEEGSIGEIDVNVTTLDDLISRYGLPALCKIDVEGHERSVLRGLSKRIEIIIIEYHTDDKSIIATNECIRLLGQFGTMKLNFTAREEAKLLFSQWIDDGNFHEYFPKCVQSHWWGDIIIRFG